MQTVPAPETPLTRARELPVIFSAAEKERALWRVGVEHEHLLATRKEISALPYAGAGGVRKLLDYLALREGLSPVWDAEQAIGLASAAFSVSLEPGGQFELSGSPFKTVGEVVAEMDRFDDMLQRAAHDLRFEVPGLGLQPFTPAAQAFVSPKRRYAIMRDYLPTQGRLALHMMHLSATVQASYDFSSEADAVLKMRVAMGVSPLVTALYANSPFLEGRSTGYASFRTVIWRNTDPARCGLLPFVWDDGFGYERYTDYALDAPMFFIRREDRYLNCSGLRFRDFLKTGWKGQHPIWQDFSDHLGTLFPEVRLQNRIELRGADAGLPEMMRAFPALWKGILYSTDACLAAEDLTRHWNFRERLDFQEEVAKCGLNAQHGKTYARDLVRELFEISAFGLKEQQKTDGVPDETSFLEPLIQRVQKTGKSPGEELLDAFRRGEAVAAIVKRTDYFGPRE